MTITLWLNLKPPLEFQEAALSHNVNTQKKREVKLKWLHHRCWFLNWQWHSFWLPISESAATQFLAADFQIRSDEVLAADLWIDSDIVFRCRFLNRQQRGFGCRFLDRQLSSFRYWFLDRQRRSFHCRFLNWQSLSLIESLGRQSGYLKELRGRDKTIFGQTKTGARAYLNQPQTPHLI